MKHELPCQARGETKPKVSGEDLESSRVVEVSLRGRENQTINTKTEQPSASAQLEEQEIPDKGKVPPVLSCVNQTPMYLRDAAEDYTKPSVPTLLHVSGESVVSGVTQTPLHLKDVVKGQTKLSVASLNVSSESRSRDDEALLLGQTYTSLFDEDIPDFVRQHNTGLTFPQKVSIPRRIFGCLDVEDPR
jgi:hypothetical protein